MIRHDQLLTPALLVLLASGCTDSPDTTINSEAVATSDLYATFQVIAEGDERVFVEAQMTVEVPPSEGSDDDIFVELSSNDSLVVSGDIDIEQAELPGEDLFAELDALYDQYVPMKKAQTSAQAHSFLFGDFRLYDSNIWYRANLPQARDRQYNISLLRPNFRNAEAVEVTLPEAFTLQVNNRVYSRSDDPIPLSWTTGDEAVSVQLHTKLSCANGVTRAMETTLNTDTGQYTYPAGALADEGVHGPCSATVSLRKVRLGQFDPAFSGGMVLGYQVRNIAFNTDD